MKKIKLIIILTVSILIVALVILFFVMKPNFNALPEKHFQEIKQLFSDFEPVRLVELENKLEYVARYDLTVDEWNSIKSRIRRFSAESSKSVRGETMMIDELFTQEEIDSILGGYLELYSFPSFITKYYCRTMIGEIHTDKGVSISVCSFVGAYKTFSLFK